MAEAFASCNARNFWSEVKKVNKSSKGQSSISSIDGVSGDLPISNLWASKLCGLYNSQDVTERDNLQANVMSNILSNDLADLGVSPDLVLECIGRLKPGKSDGTSLSSDCFISAAPVITDSLAQLFTAILRHGYVPASLWDCLIVPIPKGHKDPSVSDNYRSIALAPSLSKILEWVILSQFSEFFLTSDLQFGFKKGMSTSLCTGFVKCVVAQYLTNDSPVYGCFLDLSKAFDLVDHNLLFRRLLDRSLPLPIVRLLMTWYRDQNMRVRWNRTFSDSFSVSNGVRQGGVLSPILFTVYVDELLLQLKQLGVGCHWKHHFVGAVCYADDLSLLAPSQAALRLMLRLCEQFADSHGLRFNASKTQLIRFGRCPSVKCSSRFSFCSTSLPFLNSVAHLGHILRYDLDDYDDILRATRDLVRRSNCILQTFAGVDSFVMTKLVQAFCLSLYGSSLWKLSCKSISVIEVSLNKVLRRVWHLPRNSHTAIVHCTARLYSIFNVVYSMSRELLHSALCCSSSSVVQSVFLDSSYLCYTSVGFNAIYGDRLFKRYYPQDFQCAEVIRSYRAQFGYSQPSC